MNARIACCCMVLLGCCVSAHSQQLPLVEIRPQLRSERLAIFYSGDGGWAGLDQGVSARLAAAGTHVIGINSLRYFWRERRPEAAADDLEHLLRAQLADRPANAEVLLIGYSRGADVLPFIVNRLPEQLRARVTSITLIAPGHETTFKIQISDWLPGRGGAGLPVLPEIERLGLPLLCLYGDDDRDASCPEIPAERAASVKIGTGHHLGGDYQMIAERILAFAQLASTARKGER